MSTTIRVLLDSAGRPARRLPLTLTRGGGFMEIAVQTDENGEIHINGEPGEQIELLNAGRCLYRGPLAPRLTLTLLSDAQAGRRQGAPSGIGGGSIAYPSMQIDHVVVDGRRIETDSEGYIVRPDEWSEGFARALAEKEGLELTEEHWEVIYFLRDFYNQKHVQCTVRDMIRHFRKVWDRDRGSNRYLHQIFPNGGPQKQGNRLAGLLRTKGEH
ncbi:TusE/DsrC/DsvC family sulfur relay protein [endosymbiont of unidentified scaly snail isolate Monju]|uniref:TusE/DsrC/DsvC family sulfur relay protein n=1 Tax=endosymbiont of unidentified scaly snail isolate Monju TaxID=1248727 RepID=UPI0011DD25AD|nr:TusE/DsrC/DsvC family sulfur relay protein [endosymbiont of unidentified scaly snail isolate Monju]